METRDFRDLTEAYYQIYDDSYDLSEGKKSRQRQDLIRAFEMGHQDTAKYNPSASAVSPKQVRKKAKAAAKAAIPESQEIYGDLVSYLIDEGYTDTVEGAEVLIDNMSEGLLRNLKKKVKETIEKEKGRQAKITAELNKPHRNTSHIPVRPTNEETYVAVLAYLLDEGYADTQESAEVIMANMSEEWLTEILDENVITTIKNKGRKHLNQYAYHQGIHPNPGWVRNPEKRRELRGGVFARIRKNPRAFLGYIKGQVKKKITGKAPKTGITGTLD